MAKLKVMTILGTRPEIIRLSETIKACDKAFDHILVHTGQNYAYELNGVFFKELGLRKPDYTLNCVGKNLGETMGNVISKTYDLISEIKPDAILILGDTNSALSAISAKRLKCPIFHMEAGNRCWDWNVAEMTNRTIVDHISDVNLPYSHVAYDNLIREGMPANRTFITGSPMKEVIMAHKSEIDACDVVKQIGLKDDDYIVVSAHREENVDIEEKFNRLYPALNKIADDYKMPVVFSVHPRTQKQFDKKGFILSKYIQDDKPFGFFEYIALQKHAYVVLSDSGTLTEESSILDFPAVLSRTSTERQEGIIHGSIVQGGVDYESINEAIKKARFIHREGPKLSIVPDYDVNNVSEKVVNFIKRYISVVNKETWLR
ncbi:MAG: UDP-N-acetylglucosamine 2-epimerase (non-hydrolyzing) [Bacilli bacterium]|jgi:UDP-N-acetylglucosamine 2-epimerase (non-hydrolysing)|nr:UDP-N-acetylglucosamine 2-epimerase (non-hydrolyzing) [Bacilli bacterium]